MNDKNTAQYVEMLLTRKAPPGKGRNVVSARTQKKVRALYAVTASISAVARALSHSKETVRRIIQDEN
jgi:DNA invertase Pin-like site-specific DNA recombinase